MAPEDSQMCGGNFPKRKQSNANLVPKYYVWLLLRAINSNRGAQHFALHLAGIALPSRLCFWILVFIVDRAFAMVFRVD